MQVIVMTSDLCSYSLPGFFHQWEKYYRGEHTGVLVGFSKPDVKLPDNFRFVSQGKQEDFPRSRWSFRLKNVLEEIADDVFMLLLDDYWLIRQVDIRAIEMIHDYMEQFRNVLKFDLAFERLYSNTPPGGHNKFYFGHNTYDRLGHLDLIKSDPGSDYHMSLWGGMYRNELLKSILVPGESAQEIEINGTHRLSELGDEMLVLGTRQAPLLHVNALQGRGWNKAEGFGVLGLSKSDLEELNQYYDWATILS